jgi:coronin-1B/1C/6
MFSMESLYSPDGEPSTTPKVTAKPFTPVATSATAPSPIKASPVVSAPEPKPVSIPESVESAPSPVKETPAPELDEKHAPPTAEVVETPKEPVRPKSPVKVAPPVVNSSPVKPSAAPPPAAPAPAPAPASAQADNHISEQLSKITSLLEIQNKTLVSQNAQIADLTRELDTLKSKVSDGDSGRKDEIIRKLELELEEARS